MTQLSGWRGAFAGPFRSLRVRNYRRWAAGAFVSNVGTWMQRTAQDWLVLTELTNHSALAVGILMALQFGPQLFLLPWIGVAVDRFNRRRLVIFTQAAMGILALCLGVLAITESVQLWHVYCIATLLGIVSAFDAPARQTFVSDLVGNDDVASAVALNSTSFNAGRTIGPAIAGLCIAVWGTAWAFLINGASFLGVLISLAMIRTDQQAGAQSQLAIRGSLAESLKYIWIRPDLRMALIMLALIGTFGLNFPIFISTMSVTVFEMGAGRYGLLTSAMAAGTIIGALIAGIQQRPTIRGLAAAATCFAISLAIASAMPTFWSFGTVLFLVGISALLFVNMSNSLMQLAAEPALRGRVVAIRLAVVSGSTFIGAPAAGWIADQVGPRYALAVGAAAALIAAIAGWRHVSPSTTVPVATPPRNFVKSADDDVPTA